MIVRVVQLVVILCIIIYFSGKVNAQLSSDLYEDPRIIVKSRTYFTDGIRGPISYGASQGPELVSANGQVTGNRKLDIYIRHKPGYITSGLPGLYGQISASKGPIINLSTKPGYYGPGLGMDALGEFPAMAMPADISGRGRGILDTLPNVAPWSVGQLRPTVSSLLYGGSDIYPTIGQQGVNGRPGINLGNRPGYYSGGLGNDLIDPLGEISPTLIAKLTGLDGFSSAMPWLANQPRSTLAPSLYGGSEMYPINGQVSANRFPNINSGIKPYPYGGSTGLGIPDALPSYAPWAVGQPRPSMLPLPYGGSELYPQTGLSAPNRVPFMNLGNRPSYLPGSEAYGPYGLPNVNRLPINSQYPGNRPGFGNPHSLYTPSGLEMNPTNSPINIPGQLNPYTGLNNNYAPGTEIPNIINGQIQPYGGLNNIFGGNPSLYTPGGSGMYPQINPLNINGQINPYNPSLYGSEIPSIINGQMNPYSGHNNPGIYPAGGSEMYPTINPLNPTGLFDVDRNRPGCHMTKVPETYLMNGQTNPQPYSGLNNILGQIPRYYGTGCPKSYDTNGPIIPNRGLNTNFGNIPSMYGNAGLETYLPNDPVNMNRGMGVNYNNRPGYSSNTGLDMFPPRPIYGNMATSHNTGFGPDMYGSKLPIHSTLSRLLQNYDGSGTGLFNGNESF